MIYQFQQFCCCQITNISGLFDCQDFVINLDMDIIPSKKGYNPKKKTEEKDRKQNDADTYLICLVDYYEYTCLKC